MDIYIGFLPLPGQWERMTSAYADLFYTPVRHFARKATPYREFYFFNKTEVMLIKYNKKEKASIKIQNIMLKQGTKYILFVTLITEFLR